MARPKSIRLVRACEQCGARLLVTKATARRGQGRFCNLTCHWLWRHAQGDASPEAAARRFWKRVRKTRSCWLWTGRKNRHGYGTTRRGGRGRGTQMLAHRLSWELRFGPIPGGLCVLHKCDVPACVRPSHLFLGTRRDNAMDCKQKNRNNRKVSDAQARTIRRRYARGGVTYDVLAAAYGVTRSAIYRIIKGYNHPCSE